MYDLSVPKIAFGRICLIEIFLLFYDLILLQVHQKLSQMELHWLSISKNMGIILLKHKKVGEPSQLELGKYFRLYFRNSFILFFCDFIII